jgi:hypothetical protein
MTEEVISQMSSFSILTSVRFPDGKQVVTFQSLADLLCDLLQQNLCKAVIPAFRKFFSDAMLGDLELYFFKKDLKYFTHFNQRSIAFLSLVILIEQTET